MPQKKIVLKDIAAKAKVHLTTAARAMKNDPRVHSETLAKVQRIAQELGYVPDPMLAALSTYRTNTRHSLYRGTVGWITNFPTPDGWKFEAFRHYRQGASEALAEYGYQLEDHWLQAPGLTLRRAAQILQSRGIRGLLICPLPMQFSQFAFSFERFASVTFGYTLRQPSLHLVTTSHYQNMRICLKQIYQLGYRRPGWIVWDEMSRRVYEQWTAAYKAPSTESWEEDIPILCLKEFPEPFSAENKAAFFRWFETYRPSVILVVDQHILQWLREAGIRVPEDVAYVSPSLQESNRGHSGVLEPSLEVGHAAGELLVGMLARGECGIPRVPRRVTLDGEWQAGMTVRPEGQFMRESAGAALGSFDVNI